MGGRVRQAIISGLSVVVSATLSFLMKPLFPAGDWRWGIIVAVGSFVAWLLWFTDPKRRWESFRVSHDGREVAKKIARIPNRHTDRADAIYRAYKSLPSELKQFSEEADYGYWYWLHTHWPDRATQFASELHGGSLYETWKGRTRHLGINYGWRPWWKRVWARLRW